MKKDDIKKHFEEFIIKQKEQGNNPYLKLNDFFESERKKFQKEGNYQSEIQARQGWVTILGSVLEDIVIL